METKQLWDLVQRCHEQNELVLNAGDQLTLDSVDISENEFKIVMFDFSDLSTFFSLQNSWIT